MSYDYLRDQIAHVKHDIEKVCEKMNKSIGSVTLLGVTKTYEADVINASIEYGITDIAENKVQEIIRKYDAIQKGVKWHLIGHLQTNKVKYIIDKVDLIHSVDSVKLAVEINSRASKIGKVQDVLIQINVADETQKYGISPDALDGLLEQLSELANIKVLGLMNIAPLVDDPESLRMDFKVMSALYERLKHCAYVNVDAQILSMGMSNDYDIAIEEGSNMVRIGTKIYGKRL
jgi:hypothetical protein